MRAGIVARGTAYNRRCGLKVSILGCGYVGLVTGACLAEIDHEVTCTDNDLSKIQTLQHGTSPIYEPRLDEIVARNTQNGRLKFTGDMGEAVRFGDAVFICVGTPPLEDGDANLSAIDNCARLIAAESRRTKLVIEKSTVPMQTGMGLDPRIGPQFLRPDLGFGGFCLPKDIQAFIRLGEKAGVDVRLLKEAEYINKKRIDSFLAKVRQALWVLKDKRIGILGLAFKPNTDDIRFAPAVEILRKLQQEHAQLQVYDPQAMEKAKPLFPSIRYCSDPYEAAENADALLIVTEWPEFKELEWQRIRDSMLRPLVVDGRNVLDGVKMAELGFEYQGVGKEGHMAILGSMAGFSTRSPNLSRRHNSTEASP